MTDRADASEAPATSDTATSAYPPAAPAAPPQPPPQPAAQPVAAPVAAPAAAPVYKDPRRRSPVLASILSFMPGLGQVYVGYYQRGFVHAIVVAILISLFDAPAGLRPAEPLIGVFLAFFWLYNVIDAGRRALFYNEALAGRGDIDLPRDFSFGLGGSLVGGIVVIAIGAILLSHTLFDASLVWLEEWWPAAVIVFGAYLVWKAMQEKKAAGEAAEV